MGDDPLFRRYLTLYLCAWKKAYKLVWIFHQLIDEFGAAQVEEFWSKAVREKYPLFPLEKGQLIFSCSYFTVCCSRRFSDWLFDKSPTEESFLRSVEKSKAALIFDADKNKLAKKEASSKLQERRREARDELGGGTVNLRFDQLRYLSNGRVTGFATSPHLKGKVYYKK